MEIWKDIENYEGLYQVSNFGNVRSLDRYVKNRGGQRIAKGGEVAKTNCQGYLIASLSNSEGKVKRISRLVHRLVAKAFLDRIDGKDVVNHKDGNRKNNHVDNLEWCTTMENVHHAIRTGLTQINGEKHPHTKLKNVQAIEVRKKYAAGNTSYSRLGNEYNVSWNIIRRIVKNKSYTHV